MRRLGKGIWGWITGFLLSQWVAIWDLMHSRFFWAALLSPFILVGLLIWWFDGDVDFKRTAFGEFWGWFGTRRIDTPQTTERESAGTILRNLGLLIGGVEALIFALWRVRIADRNARASEGQTDIAQQSLLNDRYQRAVELLASEALPVRLGGLHALQRLAEERADEYYYPVMNLLCALVRSAPRLEGPIDEQGLPRVSVPIQLDAQEAIVAIVEMRGRAMTTDGKPMFGLNLEGSNLRNAKLDHLDLSSAPRYYPTHGSLHRILQSRRTDLGGADLEGASTFMTGVSGVDFSGDGSRPARGLTLSQLQDAKWDDDRPPNLEGVRDLISRRGLQEELDRVRNSDLQENLS